MHAINGPELCSRPDSRPDSHPDSRPADVTASGPGSDRCANTPVTAGTSVTAGTAREAAGCPDATSGIVGGTGTQAERLLHRLVRHTPLQSGRVVLALVQRRRGYVTATGWIRTADLETDPEQAPYGLAEQSLRVRVQQTLDRLDLPPRNRRAKYTLVIARCRSGRVVWLPADLAWVQVTSELAERIRLDVLDAYLVTEHGWRSSETSDAGGSGSGGTHPFLAT